MKSTLLIILSFALAFIVLTGCSSSLVIRVNDNKPFKTTVSGDTPYIQFIKPDNYIKPQYGLLENYK